MAVGLKKMGKPSPLKILPWVAANPMAAMGIAQAGVSVLGGLIGGRKRRREQRKAREAMEASRRAYMDQEYVNPYANLENPYEDLTVNQQQAQFQAQQGAQQRADILGGLRETAGGAGIAGLAQAMAQQSTLQTQQISASIGQQEARNQRLRAQGAMQTQRLERYGEQIRQGKEEQRIQTLYGMDMGRLTAANKARQQARQQMISGIGRGLGTIAQGIGMGETPWAKAGGAANVDGSLDVGLQRGSVQGLNYVPPQTNQFQFDQGPSFNFSQQQGLLQPNQNLMGKTFNIMTGQWE
tara:strand:- start:1728 stop:2615 length:888 start_codon:yes stop_codon:yes gene_type:complete